MGLFRNTLVSTARPQFNASTKTTSLPQNYLTGIEATVAPVPAQSYQSLPPDLALKRLFLMQVDTGTDIRIGDTLTRIVSNDERLLPWPFDGQTPGGINTAWIVRYTADTTIGPLAQLNMYIERVDIGAGAR